MLKIIAYKATGPNRAAIYKYSCFIFIIETGDFVFNINLLESLLLHLFDDSEDSFS